MTFYDIITNHTKINKGFLPLRYVISAALAIVIVVMWCTPFLRYHQGVEPSSRFIIKYSIKSNLMHLHPVLLRFPEYIEIGELCGKTQDRFLDAKIYRDQIELFYLRLIAKDNAVEQGFDFVTDWTVNCIWDKVTALTLATTQRNIDQTVRRFSDQYAELLIDINDSELRLAKVRDISNYMQDLLRDDLLIRSTIQQTYNKKNLVEVRRHDSIPIPLNELDISDWRQIIATNIIGTTLILIIILYVNIGDIIRCLRRRKRRNISVRCNNDFKSDGIENH